MTDEAGVTDLVAEVSARLGPVTTPVVNATGPQPEQEAETVTWEDHLAQLTFFVRSPALLMEAVLPGMRERGGGRVVQIGSDILERVLPSMSAHTAAKAAQHSLTESWARAFGPYGITVNTAAPGWIPVERHASARPEELAGYAAQVPLGRGDAPVRGAATAGIAGAVGAAGARWCGGEGSDHHAGQGVDRTDPHHRRS